VPFISSIYPYLALPPSHLRTNSHPSSFHYLSSLFFFSSSLPLATKHATAARLEHADGNGHISYFMGSYYTGTFRYSFLLFSFFYYLFFVVFIQTLYNMIALGIDIIALVSYKGDDPNSFWVNPKHLVCFAFFCFF
jgi:hypothetical protein